MNSPNRERRIYRYRRMADKRLAFIAGQRMVSLLSAIGRLESALAAWDDRRDIRYGTVGQPRNHHDRGYVLMSQLDNVVRQLLHHVQGNGLPGPKQ